jgi:hypothetical protein
MDVIQIDKVPEKDQELDLRSDMGLSSGRYRGIDVKPDEEIPSIRVERIGDLPAVSNPIQMITFRC